MIAGSSLLYACGSGGGNSEPVVAVSPPNAKPEYTGSTAFSFDEGQEFTTQIQASDPDGDSLSYSISSSSSDGEFFEITQLGELRTIDNFDFETPEDQDINNIYVIDVEISDSTDITSVALQFTVNNIEGRVKTTSLLEAFPTEFYSNLYNDPEFVPCAFLNLDISASGDHIVFDSKPGLCTGQNGYADTIQIYNPSEQTFQELDLRDDPIRSFGETEINGYSDISVSADGRFIAFSARTPGVLGGVAYIYDRQSDVYAPISNSAGVVAAGQFESIEISNDGKYVVFSTSASNLYDKAPFDQTYDTFVYNRVTGALEVIAPELAQKASDANLAFNADCSFNLQFPCGFGYAGNARPQISENGRYVMFNSWPDWYIHDQTEGITRKILPDGVSIGEYKFAGDGSSIAIAGFSPELVKDIVFEEGQTGDNRAFIYDLDTESNHFILGTDTSDQHDTRYIDSSEDGRYHVFGTSVDLVPEDTNFSHDIYRYDRIDGSLLLVSADEDGFPYVSDGDDRHSYSQVSISGDGHTVVFSRRTDVGESPFGVIEDKIVAIID